MIQNYWMVMDFRMHVSSSDMRYRCDCFSCTHPGAEREGFTKDPLKAWSIDTKAGAEAVLKVSKNGMFKNCKVTEHEFIN